MLKFKLVFVAVLLVLLLGFWFFAYVYVPPSVRVMLAAGATCDLVDSDLASQNDPHFEGIKFWEPPLASFYRWQIMSFGGPVNSFDYMLGDGSVLHSTIVAATSLPDRCEADVLELFESFLASGANVNKYLWGMTPIQHAIIYSKVKYVVLLHNYDADLSLPVRIGQEGIDGLNAVELSRLFFKNTDNEENRIRQADILKVISGDV